jgi:hypothetical protein
MQPPTQDTWLIVLLNLVGWVVAIWRNSTRNYQHRAMWREYAERKKIPINGE